MIKISYMFSSQFRKALSDKIPTKHCNKAVLVRNRLGLLSCQVTHSGRWLIAPSILRTVSSPAIAFWFQIKVCNALRAWRRSLPATAKRPLSCGCECGGVEPRHSINSAGEHAQFPGDSYIFIWPLGITVTSDLSQNLRIRIPVHRFFFSLDTYMNFSSF